MDVLIISSIMSKQSKPHKLGETILKSFQHHDITTDLICAEDLNLPICDGYLCYQDKHVIELQQKVAQAKALIFCSPVYNYDLNAIAKNIMELAGQQFTDKVAAVAVTAGGEKSYMAPLGFINSLMIDYRCVVVPRFLYVTGSQFNDQNEISDESIIQRIDQLVLATKTLLRAIQ